MGLLWRAGVALGRWHSDLGGPLLPTQLGAWCTGERGGGRRHGLSLYPLSEQSLGIAGRYHHIPSLHTPNVFDVKSSQEFDLPSGFLSHPRVGLVRYGPWGQGRFYKLCSVDFGGGDSPPLFSLPYYLNQPIQGEHLLFSGMTLAHFLSWCVFGFFFFFFSFIFFNFN